jgi:hypothetical protein
MIKIKFLVSKDPVQKWIILGIPVISIIGSLMHFIYEWSGNSLIVGIFAPINESVWEHLKLSFWPAFIWWLIGYLYLSKNNMVPTAQWFVSCAIAELVYPLVILSFYYTYTGALGIESLILDIFSFFLAVALGQAISLHLYKHAKLSRYSLYFAAAILIFLASAFTIFIFEPPHLPMLKDSMTGKYGI